jgi:ribosomal protein S18 acetylase RimI-like enzyme
MSEIQIRPATDADIEAMHGVDERAFGDLERRIHPQDAPDFEEELEVWADAGPKIMRHVVGTDPEGCFVAEGESGVVGLALSLRRDDLWILSILAVDPSCQGQGIGERLLNRALEYGEAGRPHVLLASEDHRAMRRYAKAGFKLRPTLYGRGPIDRELLPAGLNVRDGWLNDVDFTIAVDQRHRGRPHGSDIAALLEVGGRLFVAERDGGRGGYAVVGIEGCELLVADDDTTAQELAWATAAAWESPRDYKLGYISAGQDWAVDVCLAARLRLGFSGCLCLRDWEGPAAAYLPNGMFL